MVTNCGCLSGGSAFIFWPFLEGWEMTFLTGLTLLTQWVLLTRRGGGTGKERGSHG